MTVFQRLPQNLERRAAELRKLIQEQNSAMGKRYFPGTGVATPARKPACRDGVVRRPEGAPSHERAVSLTGCAIYFGYLDALLAGERR
jgi:hypothetical protein